MASDNCDNLVVMSSLIGISRQEERRSEAVLLLGFLDVGLDVKIEGI